MHFKASLQSKSYNFDPCLITVIVSKTVALALYNLFKDSLIFHRVEGVKCFPDVGIWNALHAEHSLYLHSAPVREAHFVVGVCCSIAQFVNIFLVNESVYYLLGIIFGDAPFEEFLAYVGYAVLRGTAQ